jgi:hypothetical protein
MLDQFSKGEAARKAENKSPEVPELLTNPNTQDDAEFVIRAEGGSGISREKFLLHQPPAETNKKIEPVTPGRKLQNEKRRRLLLVILQTKESWLGICGLIKEPKIAFHPGKNYSREHSASRRKASAT